MTDRHICPPDHAHARTLTCASSHRCGCDACRKNWAAYHRWLRNSRRQGKQRAGTKIPAWPSQRRVGTLVALGWSMQEIGRRAGISPTNVRNIQYYDRITRVKAAKIDRVWRELKFTKRVPTSKEERVSVKGALACAKRHGWVPAILWDDIDDPDCTPDTDGIRDETGWALDELEHLRLLNVSATEALASLPQTPASLERQATRHDRGELAAWIRTARNAA